jgi:hypothetical protein
VDLVATPAATSGAVSSWKPGAGSGSVRVRLVGALAAAPGKSGELAFDLRRGGQAERRLAAARWGNRAHVSAEVRVSPELAAGGKRFWQRPHRARLFVVDAAGRRLYLPNASIVDRPQATGGWLALEGLVTTDVPVPLGFTDSRFDPNRVVRVGVGFESGNRVGEVVEGTVELRDLRVALHDAAAPRVRPEDPAVRAGERERGRRMEARLAALGLGAGAAAVGVNLAWPTARSPEGEEMQLYGRLLDGGTKWWDSHWDLGEEAVVASVREDFRAIRATFGRAGGPPPVVRIWLFGDLRSGVTFDGEGTPVAVTDRSRRSLDVLLRLAVEEGVVLVPVLLDFGMADGVGRTGPDGAWVVGERPDLVIDPDRRGRLVALLEAFMKPVAAHPAVLAWDVMNEPENAAAVATPRHFADLQALIGELVDAVHRAGGLATVGHRNPVDAARFFRGRAASDLGQAHYYPLLETRPNPSRLDMSFREVFGPLPAGWGELPAEPGRIARHLAGARRAGHRIFWFWAWRGHQESGDGFAVQPYAGEIRRALGAPAARP